MPALCNSMTIHHSRGIQTTAALLALGAGTILLNWTWATAEKFLLVRLVSLAVIVSMAIGATVYMVMDRPAPEPEVQPEPEPRRITVRRTPVVLPPQGAVVPMAIAPWVLFGLILISITYLVLTDPGDDAIRTNEMFLCLLVTGVIFLTVTVAVDAPNEQRVKNLQRYPKTDTLDCVRATLPYETAADTKERQLKEETDNPSLQEFNSVINR